MIGFRQVDGRFPFLWDSSAQPAGRWHHEGEGPVHYLADSPDGAWAEFLRHEEIVDIDDLATSRRQMWVVEIGSAPAVGVCAPAAMLGGAETYPACQEESRRLREGDSHDSEVRVDRIAAPSAALDGAVVIVVFAPAAELTGWVAADAARPHPDLLDRVRHYGSS